MSSGSDNGALCIVLHAHLPYVYHPEYEFFLEENWLYEALTETYIPLLEVFGRLLADGVEFGITLSLSPSLAEMLNNAVLRQRYIRHLERLIELSEREIRRTRRDIRFNILARMYRKKFIQAYNLFCNSFRKDIIGVLKEMQEQGNIHILTSAATHAFLPNLSSVPQAVRAQIETGVINYKKNFSRQPEGIWLPECGFAPGYDSYLSEAGLRFFYLDTHGLMNGNPAPACRVYSPVKCPSGIMAFGRDAYTSQQVWSSRGGYPGDFAYRDFYRDIGYDLDTDYIKKYLQPFAAKTFAGIKYYRITGSDKKEPYNMENANAKAAEHARHFISRRNEQINSLADELKIKPVVTAAYDAELLGHWWFEGPQWLEFLIRGVHKSACCFRMLTTSRYMNENCQNQDFIPVCEPSMSSWGEKGYSNVWLNASNDYAYRHMLKTAERMAGLAEAFPSAQGVCKRALNQAAREVLLSQHSDWTFIMNAGTAKEYAKKRFETHISRFNRLYQYLKAGDINTELLEELEQKDYIFSEIDYGIYRS